MRFLGLDVGERRIGLAVSDPDGRVAVPLRVLRRSGGRDDFVAIAEAARAEEAGMLVVGLPLSMDGSLGPQARSVQAFGEVLAGETGLPVEYWDERLSTVQAERRPMRSRRAERRRPPQRRERASSDALAAALVLQAFLDSRRAAQ